MIDWELLRMTVAFNSFITVLNFLLIYWIYRRLTHAKVKFLLPGVLVLLEVLFINSSSTINLPFLDPLLLVIIASVYQKELPLKERLFFSVLSSVFVDIFSRFSAFYILSSYFSKDITSINHDALWLTMTYLLVIPFYFCVEYTITFDSRMYHSIVTQRNPYYWRILQCLSVSMIAYYIVVYGLLLLQELRLWPSAEITRQILVCTYGLIFLYLLSTLGKSAHKNIQDKMASEQARRVTNIEHYGNRMEQLYQEILVFEDEYKEMLEQLKKSCDSGDIDKIRATYQKLVGKNIDYYSSSHFELGRLVTIENSTLKSILSAKILEAEEKGIVISTEFPDVIKDTPMSNLDLAIVISILFDNAIEAAQRAVHPMIRMAFFKNFDSHLFIISNTTAEESINTSSIFELGMSSKGDDRGFGLSNVSQILDDYPMAMLSTSSSHFEFTQKLELLSSVV
ncbi:GHKL domain-containing protein [Streptococcus saliviloxodontae]|uniref:Two-component system sensor histidine kinase AgrC n=1 Tax=Streptococcus saliviloxodontae TaxID=1349416 RepID=A0ABS2PN35_9STRE|nr:GHKL domain-containing protein [Streptococcus saliviloxodontae]MBM7636849.1 two-component system sensor histidine kinase AgrC [Streptococcus saliviloxodontae]